MHLLQSDRSGLMASRKLDRVFETAKFIPWLKELDLHQVQ